MSQADASVSTRRRRMSGLSPPPDTPLPPSPLPPPTDPPPTVPPAALQLLGRALTVLSGLAGGLLAGFSLAISALRPALAAAVRLAADELVPFLLFAALSLLVAIPVHIGLRLWCIWQVTQAAATASLSLLRYLAPDTMALVEWHLAWITWRLHMLHYYVLVIRWHVVGWWQRAVAIGRAVSGWWRAAARAWRTARLATLTWWHEGIVRFALRAPG